VIGGIILVNFAILMLGTFVLSSATGSGSVLTAGICVGVVVGLFGAAFLFVGVQSVRGTANDTLGNGIGSIIFAVLVLGSAVAGFMVEAWLQAVVNTLSGAGLMAAGVMALVGRADYRFWRRVQRRSRSSRRGRDYD